MDEYEVLSEKCPHCDSNLKKHWIDASNTVKNPNWLEGRGPYCPKPGCPGVDEQ